RTLKDLTSQIDQALAERQKIAARLKQTEELSAQGQYQQALTLLEEIKVNPYIADNERTLVQNSIDEIRDKLQVENNQMQQIYDQAAKDYLAGDYEKAKAGFLQVAESNVSVTGSLTPMDYLKMIDQVQQTSAAAKPTPDAEPQLSAGEEIEIELMQMVPTEPDKTIIQPQPVPEPVLSMTPSDSTIHIEVLPSSPEAAEIQPLQTETAPAVHVSAPVSTDQTDSYLNEVQRKQSVQIGYTTAIVNDALAKAAQFLAQNDFTQARQSLRKAFVTIETNKLLLGDELYKGFQRQLTQKEEQVAHQQEAFNAQQQSAQEQQARQLADQNRQAMEQRRAKAIEDFMQRAYSFLDEQRYDEALGQLEQLLAVDPLNHSALILKRTLEDTVMWREQRKIREETDKEEIRLLLESDRKSIPYFDEITYPKNWKEIAARREAAEKEDVDPKTTAVEKQLQETVDFSS
ncbi:MAG TPA: hypothetical protein PLQ45_09635, partial [Anaerohalosphaeraceae bacterium]|nr:hypothetical protein [Anaerohalosphaeraceae bacterium]